MATSINQTINTSTSASVIDSHATFNVAGTASLDISDGGVGGDEIVNLAANSHLFLTVHLAYGSLTVNGPSATMTINGVQNAGTAKVILRTNIDGNGTFRNTSINDQGTMEIDGSVASGVTISSGEKILVLDHTKTFAGLFEGRGVDLKDITATSYKVDHVTGIVTFFNHDTSVFSLRTVGNAATASSYKAYHEPSGGAGIILAENNADGTGFNVGALLPLHT
jgi:hypothetical protein